MATVRTLQTVATAPTVIQCGPGMLWANVTKPADGDTLAVSGNASGAQDQRIYGPVPFTLSGTFMGATIGESNISYRPTFVDIDIETSTATVEKVLNSEEARCNFALAELTAENLRDSLPGAVGQGPVATLKTVDADPYMSSQYRHTITVGGLRLVQPQCIAFISANRRINLASGPFSYVYVGYNAVSTEGFEAPFSRGGVTVWRASYEQIADVSRTLGDQLFQFTVRSAVSS